MTDEDEIVRALAVLEARALEEGGFASERAAARAEFFGGAQSSDEIAQLRFREWFLLERPSAAWQTPPIQGLAHALVAEGLLEAEIVAALSNSFCSVFEVTSVVAGEGAWLRDLSSGGEHPLLEREGAAALQVGDVLIGRLFVLGPTANRISRATALFRDAKLRRALERDLEAARARRRGVPRLSQSELEALFWQREVSPGGGAVTRAREWLEASGIAPETVDAVFAELAARPADEQRWAVGAEDALGAVLEQLAFETDVDLEIARRLLLAAWVEIGQRASAGSESETPSANQERDVRAALEAFDRGRAEGRDLERLFAQLERDLGLEAEEDEPLDVVPDFPGVVGAVVEEFLWEAAREHGADAARAYEPIRQLAEFGQSIGVFENLGARQLLTFASVWLPERGGLADAGAARAALVALRAFCEWAAEGQGLELDDDFRSRLDALDESLPRIADANRFVDTGAGGGALFEVKQVGGDGTLELADAHGALRRAAASRELAARLVVGDRVRALAGPDARATILRCYPRECASVLDSA